MTKDTLRANMLPSRSHPSRKIQIISPKPHTPIFYSHETSQRNINTPHHKIHTHARLSLFSPPFPITITHSVKGVHVSPLCDQQFTHRSVSLKRCPVQWYPIDLEGDETVHTKWMRGDHWTNGSQNWFVICAYETREVGECVTEKLVLCNMVADGWRTSVKVVGVKR